MNSIEHSLLNTFRINYELVSLVSFESSTPCVDILISFLKPILIWYIIYFFHQNVNFLHDKIR